MPKKTTRQTQPPAPATASDPMAVAERRIEEARRQNATELDLFDLRLTEVPASLGKLRQLQQLNLGANQLREVPAALFELQQLRVLRLDDNQLKEAPAALGELRQLQTLQLNINQLKEVPAELSELRQLQTLWLFDNQLKEIPTALGKLRQLRTLWYTNNQLREVPADLSELRQLQTVALSNNLLREVPAALIGLQQLQELWLFDNRLRELPAALGECKKLKILLLHGNPDLGIPAEILGPTWVEIRGTNRQQSANPADILDYYFRLKRPLLEAKLILVGRGAVGKTSLVNRLVHGTFGKEKKTEGIQIIRWDVPLPGGDEAHLNVWDFGGQEIMHATHQFFLTRRSLYLLVLSGREGVADQDAEYWLKLIESFGGESPVLVVLNKQREHPFDVNQRQLQGKYHFIRGFLKTDCDDCLGLDELHRRIKEEINALPHLRDGFPTEWFAVKDNLPRTRKDFISFDQYRKACRKWKVKSEAEQNLLGRYLHDLGVMLNFREDERLQDTHVLKPHWVTEGIYTILNAPLLAEKKGELRVRDLRGILPAKDYHRTCTPSSST